MCALVQELTVGLEKWAALVKPHVEGHYYYLDRAEAKKENRVDLPVLDRTTAEKFLSEKAWAKPQKPDDVIESAEFDPKVFKHLDDKITAFGQWINVLIESVQVF